MTSVASTSGHSSPTCSPVQELHVDVAQARHRGAALDLLPATLGRGDEDGAGPPESGPEAGPALQVLEQLRGVPREHAHVVGRPQLADEAGRVPRRPGREPLALEQDHVAPAALGQVVGDARADDAAADDDDSRMAGERVDCGLI